MNGSGLWEQVDGINFKIRLLVSVFELGNVVTGPESSFHVRERLGVLKLATDLVMQKGNLVLGLVVGFRKFGSLRRLSVASSGHSMRYK